MSPRSEDPRNDYDYIPSEIELAEMMRTAQRAGLYLTKVSDDDARAVKGSWLGGQPRMPEDISWPMAWMDDEPYDEDYPSGPEPYPMHFIAQIDLAEVALHFDLEGYPKSGTLYFFYDPIHLPRGVPYARNADSAYVGRELVIHIDEDVSECPLHEMPDLDPELDDDNGEQAFVYRLNPTKGYARSSIFFEPFVGYRIREFNNCAFQVAVRETSLKNTKVRRDLHDAQNPPSDKYAQSTFTSHHLFGSNGSPQEKLDFTRILAVQGDPVTGFDFGADWIVFCAPPSDLGQCDLSHVFSYYEAY